MPYDELGNYVPGDEPSIAEMQYALAKKGQLPEVLSKAAQNVKSLATQFNPIMLPKLMQDVGTMGLNIASPVISPYVDIAHNIQAAGAAKLQIGRAHV